MASDRPSVPAKGAGAYRRTAKGKLDNYRHAELEDVAEVILRGVDLIRGRRSWRVATNLGPAAVAVFHNFAGPSVEFRNAVELAYKTKMVTSGAEPLIPTRTGRLRFDRYVLDLDRGGLLLDGKEIALRPKTFAVLLHLVDNPNRLVSKEELFAVAWPNIAVTDDALVQSIGELRRALGDDGPRPDQDDSSPWLPVRVRGLGRSRDPPTSRCIVFGRVARRGPRSRA